MMKKKFAKKLLCMSLAGAMIFSEAGVAMAAENDVQTPEEAEQVTEEQLYDATEEEKADVIEVTETVTEAASEEAPVSEVTEVTTAEETVVYEEATEETTELTETADEVASPELAADYEIALSRFDMDIDSNGGYAHFSIEGNAPEIKLYVNDVLYEEDYGSEWGGGFWWYPSVSMLCGANYKFKLELCDETGAVVVTRTKTAKINFPKFSSSADAEYSSNTKYNDKGQTTGYGKPVVYVNQYMEDYINGEMKYEVYRAEGKSNAKYSKVYEGTTYYWSSSISYTDSNVQPGKKYFYKFCLVSGTNTYVKTNAMSAMSKPVAADLSKFTAECGLSYGVDGIWINVYDYGYAGSFEIYRSTNAKKGYKLIADTSDTYYLDTKVKSGATYYYKVRPKYYDVDAKKLYRGKFGEVKAAKLILGENYASVKQTGNTRATVTWDKVAGANSYEVWIKDSKITGDAYRKVSTTTGTKYNLNGLKKEGEYSVYVLACKKSGGVTRYFESSHMNLKMGFTEYPNVYISSVRSSVSKDGKKLTITTKVKWDRVYGAKGYIIEAYDNVKGEYVKVKTIKKASATSYKMVNTSVNGSMRYGNVKVRPYRGKEIGYGSTVDVSRLPEAKGVKIKKKSATSVLVTWKKVAGANAYSIYRTAPTGNRIYIGSTNKTSFVDTYMTYGVNYSYEINAYNDKIIVNSSSAYTGYNLAVPTTSISSVKNTAKKTATVVWKKTACADKYMVYRSTSKNGKYTKIATVASKNNKYVDKKASKGKTYYYKVVVQTTNDAGITLVSKASGAKSVKIKK